jgi:nicotinamidase-related amidase
LSFGLRFGPLGHTAAHLCVDMQRIFTGDSLWAMAWFPRVLPNVELLASKRPRTVFTRFIPADAPAQGPGAWAKYYTRWASMTLSHLNEDAVELVPELARFVPPSAGIRQERLFSLALNQSLQSSL